MCAGLYSQNLRQSRILTMTFVSLNLAFVSNGLQDSSNKPGKCYIPFMYFMVTVFFKKLKLL